MKRAYLVGLLEPDDAVGGVRLASLDVFSEPSPTHMGRERTTVVLAERHADDFETAARLALEFVDAHPWLLPVLSERAKRFAGGDA